MQDSEEIESLKNNEAKVLKIGNKKVAAYKDESGHTFVSSAVCSHMSCLVGWNEKERTWNCPCHGSRFDKTGKVLRGPANRDLEKVEI